jgi:hypothetical protein
MGSSAEINPKPKPKAIATSSFEAPRILFQGLFKAYPLKLMEK